MAEPNYFDQFDGPAAQPAPAAQGPITLGTPKPREAPSGYRWGQNESLEAIPGGPADKPAGGDDKTIDREISVRKEFEGLDPVKQYRTVLPLFASAVQAGDNGAGDLNIIYALGKVMDPTSAVREGELEMAATTGSMGEQLKGYFQQINRGGRLTPEVRKQLLGELRGRTGAIADAYNQTRGSYKQLAERYGMDETSIVGSHPGEPFQQAEANFLGRPVRNLDGGQGAVPSGQQDDQVQAELKDRIARGDDPSSTIQWLISVGRQPDKATIDAIVANYRNPRPDVQPPQNGGNDIGHDVGVGIGGVLQGAGDIANAVSSPFIHGINAVFGTDYNPDMGENMRDFAGTPDPQNGAENVAFAINRGGTAALGLSGLARNAARYAEGPVSAALQQFGSRSLSDMVAGSGAATGAELTRQAGGGPVSQAAAGFIGGGLTIPATNKLSSLMTSQQGPVSTALTRAGQQEGVTVNRAMADRGSEQRVTGVGKTMLGGKMMQNDMASVGKQIEGRVQRLGQGGTALEDPVAGQTVERAAERYIKTSGKKFGRIYDSLDSEVGGVKVPATTATQRVDEVIARLSETGETHKAEIAFLKGLKKDFGKDLSVGALRDMRTTLRKKISKGDLTFGPNEARVLSIMNAASDDIATGLTAAGKGGAARRFKQIDGEYAERMDFIKNTVQKLVGKRDAHHPPGQIFANLKSMASPKGDDAALARMIREMDPDEQADMAATFANALGKNGDGEFSTAFLVKRLENMPRAAQVNLFGSEGAKSLDNLALLAKEHKRVSRALGGSPTGVANDWRSWLTNLLVGGGAGGLADGTATALATAAGAVAVKGGRDAISARTLMSPNIQNWLKSAPKTASAKAIDAHMARLKAIAVREPAIAPDIQQLQQIIARAANENLPRAGSAAASPDQGPEQQQ